MDKTILHHITYGMYVVGANDNGRPIGCVINTCIQITSENPIIAISLNKNNYTYEVIRRTGKFSLSIIAEETESQIIPTFGFQSSRDNDKYQTFGYKMSYDIPLVEGHFTGRLLCEVLSLTENGTHVVVFARLFDTVAGEGRPMSYEYYHRVLKGKAPKNAPTYQEEPESVKLEDTGKYVCTICGYIYKGDQIPDDYICPICQADRELFEEK